MADPQNVWVESWGHGSFLQDGRLLIRAAPWGHAQGAEDLARLGPITASVGPWHCRPDHSSIAAFRKRVKRS